MKFVENLGKKLLVSNLQVLNRQKFIVKYSFYYLLRLDNDSRIGFDILIVVTFSHSYFNTIYGQRKNP